MKNVSATQKAARDPRFCYVSVSVGEEPRKQTLLEHFAYSARRAGVEEDIIFFSDVRQKCLNELRVHTESFRPHYFGKIDILRRLTELDYDYFVYLDSDTYFKRNPRRRILNGVLNCCEDMPVHVGLLEDLCDPRNERKEWQTRVLATELCCMMRRDGVTVPTIYNLNGGLIMLRHDAIEVFCELADWFWRRIQAESIHHQDTSDEVALCYAMHRMCQSPENHIQYNEPLRSLWMTMPIRLERVEDVYSPFCRRGFLSGRPLGQFDPDLVHYVWAKELFMSVRPSRQPSLPVDTS